MQEQTHAQVQDLQDRLAAAKSQSTALRAQLRALTTFAPAPSPPVAAHAVTGDRPEICAPAHLIRIPSQQPVMDTLQTAKGITAGGKPAAVTPAEREAGSESTVQCGRGRSGPDEVNGTGTLPGNGNGTGTSWDSDGGCSDSDGLDSPANSTAAGPPSSPVLESDPGRVCVQADIFALSGDGGRAAAASSDIAAIVVTDYAELLRLPLEDGTEMEFDPATGWAVGESAASAASAGYQLRLL